MSAEFLRSLQLPSLYRRKPHYVNDLACVSHWMREDLVTVTAADVRKRKTGAPRPAKDRGRERTRGGRGPQLASRPDSCSGHDAGMSPSAASRIGMATR